MAYELELSTELPDNWVDAMYDSVTNEGLPAQMAALELADEKVEETRREYNVAKWKRDRIFYKISMLLAKQSLLLDLTNYHPETHQFEPISSYDIDCLDERELGLEP